MYKKPLQPRAIATEKRFLDALNDLLKEKSLGQLSIDEIADHAQLTRGAFLKRFVQKSKPSLCCGLLIAIWHLSKWWPSRLACPNLHALKTPACTCPRPWRIFRRLNFLSTVQCTRIFRKTCGLTLRLKKYFSIVWI